MVWSRLLTSSAMVLGALMAAPVAAVEFAQQAIDPNRVVAVATPVRDGEFYNLLILEQLGSRPCWQEQGSQPVRIDPLLLNFDFTGICDRKTDSNGYSIRVADQDLGLQYRLEIVRRQDDLVLRARPRDPGGTPIDIGRTGGIANDFLKIELNPGWQLTRRTYGNQALGHIYLSRAEPLDIAVAPPPAPAAPPAQNPLPAGPPAGSPLPAVPAPARPGPVASASTEQFRVYVPETSPDTLAQVRAIEPGAFRTAVSGQPAIQVGLFREQWRADAVMRQLAAAGLSPKQMTVSVPAVASTPTVPPIPQGAVVVVIDPGHGGRDPGAVGIGGLREKDINLTIARQVQQRLQQQGVTALMTRSDDREIDLDPRTVYAAQVQADLFVSIHANAISMDRPEVNGLETYYYDTGLRLAQTIHDNILRRTNLGNRGVRQARFYVLRNTAMPAVLVETGFVTGRVDAARFRDPAAVSQIAEGIAAGILAYLGR